MATSTIKSITPVDTHRYKFYTEPSQLGLSGDKTVLEIFNALPDESVIVTSDQLKATDMPGGSTTGELMIWRQIDARSHIVFHGKLSADGTYRMYLGPSSYNGNNANAPDGVWHRVYDGATVVPVSAGGTGGIGLVNVSATAQISNLAAGNYTTVSFENPNASKYKLLCISGWRVPDEIIVTNVGTNANGSVNLVRFDIYNLGTSTKSGTATIQWLAVQLN